MAGTLPILKIRSSNFLVGLLTAIPMTCYNKRKIFQILKFLTHPNIQGALYIVVIVTNPDYSGCSSAVTIPKISGL